MKKRYELDENGNFICDLLEGQEADNWTAIFCPDGLTNGRLEGASRKPDGEWVGGQWVGDPDEPLTREQVDLARLAACADPLNGSDRYFVEAIRRESLGDLEGAQAARAAGSRRYEQIKLEHPWP